MLPRRFLRSAVLFSSSSSSTGPVFVVANATAGRRSITSFKNASVDHRPPQCQYYRYASTVVPSSSKAELESINKLVAETDNAGNAEETAVVEKEDNDNWLRTRGPLPLITSRQLEYVHPSRTPRQAWVENLDTLEEKKLGLVDLHPDVFGTFPRIELINSNVIWQQKYKKVNWDWAPTRGEIHGPNKKPWPQKGMGRARHGDRKAPQWKGGGRAHGPRGPRTYFYMLPFYKRIHGLTSTLSVKLAQDDIKIVDNLDIPTDDPKYLEDLINERHWGVSVLFVDDSDIIPRNIALATDSLGHLNVMPVYGLNVFSMLKHETLVLTLAALNKIEEKLIFHLNRNDSHPPTAVKHRATLV